MIYLLDTQVIVWLATERRRISDAVIETLADPGATRAISVVSGWEYGQTRLMRPEQLPRSFDRLVAQMGAETLDFEFALHSYAESLPPIHRDPFDRLLIAQALHHDMTLVTADETIRRYPVRTLW